jgi:hypothetical protein
MPDEWLAAFMPRPPSAFANGPQVAADNDQWREGKSQLQLPANW